MKSFSRQVQEFVFFSIDPENLRNTQLSIDELVKWKQFIQKEVIKVQIALYHCTSIHSNQDQIQCLFDQALNMNNAAYMFLTSKAKFIKNNPQRQLIRDVYYFALSETKNVLDQISNKFPRIAIQSVIPNADLYNIRGALRRKYHMVEYHLRESNCDLKLTKPLISGLALLIHKKELKFSEATYLDKLIDDLLQFRDNDTQLLSNLLIEWNYNISEILLYCIDAFNTRLLATESLHEQKEMIVKEKDRLHYLILKKKIDSPFFPTLLATELCDFLGEKYEVIKKLIKLRNAKIRDSERAKVSARFLINLPVAQFALFIRMQIEKGLLLKENLGELFNFFATHFYTPHTSHISADSLQKKSTDVEFSTAQKLKALLISMLNWLNANYNLSNYN